MMEGKHFIGKICPACNAEMDWEDCPDCDNGVLTFGDFYIGDDDDWDECPTCDGSAGWYYCGHCRSATDK